ncbi:hypothetical protein [Nocardia transvalensis]|uniref:hypothetical protein n=1 Tax=Nocardia transvalensis TaxID=37333 RepID=UPI002B4AE1C9|nr:hypothetical protein [Nocardia transvalensis]
MRRGSYADEQTFEGLDAIERHRVLLSAALPDLSSGAVLSHHSAAVMYGAPVWSALLDRICVTRNRRNGGRIKPNLKVHCAPIETVADIEGVLLTTPARTIVDLARSAPFEAAVVVGDALAREYGVTATDLAIELDAAKRRTGIAWARRVVAFLEPHSESVGESRSRVMLQRLGLPMPASQGEVYTGEGQFLGRVDFYFGDTGVVGEFDGRIKYERLLRPGEEAGDAVFAEKRREDALRANGFQVVRWTWDELPTGEVLPRIRRALARSRHEHPDGFIRQAALPEPKRLITRRL